MTLETIAELFSPDLNLSPESRALIAYVGTLGEAEIPYARLMRLLRISDEKKLRRAVSEAEDAGWVTVDRQTGRGHHPRFTFTPPKNGRVKADRVPKSGSLSPPVVDVDGGDTPPISPPRAFPLSDDGLKAMERAGEKLAGCRGALRDYLEERVESRRQYGYVQTVVAWLDNPLAAFRTPDGSVVPAGERTKLLAIALNEMAATDETTRKHGAGDPANLKTKLGFVIRDRYGGHPKTNGQRSRDGPRDKPADWQDYGEGTTEFDGMNG